MEYVWDEIKQFIIKEINEHVKMENQEYYDLIKKKKYLISYYDDENNLKIIQYAGIFSNMSPCYGGAYGDIGEGYYFEGITYTEKHEKMASENIGWAYFVIGEFNSNDFSNKLDLKHKFYELEDNFNEKNVNDIFEYITANNELCDNPNGVRIKSDSISIIICSENISDDIYNDIYDDTT